ncbi:MAG: EFR1 family ferrodoxin [Acetivibrio sp.]
MVASQFPLSVEEVNITMSSAKEENRKFHKDDLVIFGIPVYGGRVPEIAMERLQDIQGHKTPAILIAAYGNRDYEDALVELKDLVEKNGFITMAAAAIITEHSIMHSVAAGRPDQEDKEKILDFSNDVWIKLQDIQDISDTAPLLLKGNFPYKEYHGVPLKPDSKRNCTKCGICAQNCPVNAISVEDPGKTNKELCISCMRCIKVCPTHARKLNGLLLATAEKSFYQKCKTRKEAEFFIE